ncbi:MAG: acyl-CoA dehydrogenase family protein [Pseudomonadota bacterium]
MNTDISFSEEQGMMRESASSFCQEQSTIDKVRAQLTTETGFDRNLWQEMTELGWLGITVPEEHGGSGLGLAEVVTIVEPMGQHLFATPFVSTTLVAQALMQAGTEAQQAKWLPAIAGEGRIGSLAFTEPHGDWDLSNITCKAEKNGAELQLSGVKTFVNDLAVADFILVTVQLEGSAALVIVEKDMLPDNAFTREVVIDETRRSYRLTLDGTSVPVSNLLETSKTNASLRHYDLAACLLLSAEMCGGISSTLSLTVDYLKTREQFNRLIGSYQALKHPMVDVLTGMDAARSHLYHAATVFDDPDESEIAVRMAKTQASDVFSYAADRAIQFHGGFGFTYDCDAQLYLRRALWCQYQCGDGQYQRKKLAALLLDD